MNVIQIDSWVIHSGYSGGEGEAEGSLTFLAGKCFLCFVFFGCFFNADSVKVLVDVRCCERTLGNPPEQRRSMTIIVSSKVK